MTLTQSFQSADAQEFGQFVCHPLDDEHAIYTGRLPKEIIFSREDFERRWEQRPEEPRTIRMHGSWVALPRLDQAFGHDYTYSGQTNSALPIPPDLAPLLAWARQVDHRLNSILVNYYDGRLRHYIGAHRDSVHNMVQNSPIVTVSFGEERVFRVRPWKGTGMQDIAVTNGSTVLLPFHTNLAFTHEVPRFARFNGRRISITFRALHENVGP